jgi:hypothetical protein
MFKRCNPPSFDGTKDASATQQWLREMEAVIHISECKEEQKVKFASHSFISEALCWWKNILHVMGAKAIERMKRKESKQLVTDQCCPISELSSLEKKFVTLEAGNQTLQEYITKFNRMARLLPYMVKPESKRVERYISGLPTDIKRRVLSARPTTFRFAVDLSRILYLEMDVATPPAIKKQGNDKRKRDDH